jgi:hypothetical protein
MLQIVSRKSALLLGIALALCAFVVPSAASAASWTPVGTTDGRIDSANFGFSIPALGGGTTTAWTQTSFSVTVDSAAVATITGASFGNGHGDIGIGFGCTLTAVATNLPWRVTTVATTSIQIHGFDLDVRFENTPGTLGECSDTAMTSGFRWTGTVTASFTPGAAGSRTFDFGGGSGLSAHFTGVTLHATTRGSAVATGLLNVLDGERCVLE